MGIEGDENQRDEACELTRAAAEQSATVAASRSAQEDQAFVDELTGWPDPHEAIRRLRADPQVLAEYQREAREWAEIDVEVID